MARDLATFDWPGDSWEDVRNLGKPDFAARYGVPVRVVRVLFRRRCAGDRRPVQYRPDPAPKQQGAGRAGVSEQVARVALSTAEEVRQSVDEVMAPWEVERKSGPGATAAEIDRHIEEFRAREAQEERARQEQRRRLQEAAARRVRRQQRLLRRQRRRAARRKRLEEPPKRNVLYACQAKHHEHCKGALRGAPCTCPCHKPRHRAWLQRRLDAWHLGEAEQRQQQHDARREARPTSDAEFIRANKQWNQDQQDLERMREARRRREWQEPRASLASYPISEEEVELISAIADGVVYQWGRPRDVWIEGLGDQAVQALERLSHCTDERAKTDLWWQHQDQYWWAHYPKSPGQQAEYSRARRAEFREAGLCTSCGKVESAEGRAMCPGCAKKAREAARRHQERNSQRAREQYRRRRAAGLCGICGKRPSGDAAMCRACQAAKRLRSGRRNRRSEPYYLRKRQQYRERVKAGLCGHCGAPQAEGRTICARCREQERASKRRYLSRQRLSRLRAARQRLAAALSSVGRRLAAALAGRDSA